MKNEMSVKEFVARSDEIIEILELHLKYLKMLEKSLGEENITLRKIVNDNNDCKKV